MLRKLLLGLGLLMLAGGLALLFAQPANGFPLLVCGGLLTLSAVFERWRYKQSKTAAAAKGTATGERFIDPETGALMEVYYDASTGERSYVKLGDTPRG
ncbi:MAG TPA: hypothetical protein VGH71_07475 [Gammaproteobacteria bacterium]|jgi:hypothetical protein